MGGDGDVARLLLLACCGLACGVSSPLTYHAGRAVIGIAALSGGADIVSRCSALASAVFHAALAQARLPVPSVRKALLEFPSQRLAHILTRQLIKLASTREA